MRSPGRAAVLVAFVALALSSDVRAEEGDGARERARRAIETVRSPEHRARFVVELPPARPLPIRGEARLEDRTGRFVTLESGLLLELEAREARLTLVGREHLPVFAARAAGRRDRGWLHEATIPVAEGREALAALELIARARVREASAAATPNAPEEAPESDAPVASWPRLELDLQARRSSCSGELGAVARRLLLDLGRAHGLGPPADPVPARRRLMREIPGGGNAMSRAAFVLGEAVFFEALPVLSSPEGQDARDALTKLEALARKDARPKLLELSTGSNSWDVRAWAREILETRADGRVSWVSALLGTNDPSEEALEEALAVLDPTLLAAQRPAVAKLLEDVRPSVRVAAAAAVARLDAGAGPRRVLLAAARDPSVPDPVRESALVRLADLGPSAERAALLAPLVADPAAPAGLKTEAARALERSGAPDARSELESGLGLELSATKAERAKPERVDLRGALVAAVAAVTSLGTAPPALAIALAVETDDGVRSLLVHALGALAPGAVLPDAVEAARREALASGAWPLTLRACDLEARARAEGSDRVRAVADAACEAPLAPTLARLLALPLSDRPALEERLRARGDLGERILDRLRPGTPDRAPLGPGTPDLAPLGPGTPDLAPLGPRRP